MDQGTVMLTSIMSLYLFLDKVKVISISLPCLRLVFPGQTDTVHYFYCLWGHFTVLSVF